MKEFEKKHNKRYHEDIMLDDGERTRYTAKILEKSSIFLMLGFEDDSTAMVFSRRRKQHTT